MMVIDALRLSGTLHSNILLFSTWQELFHYFVSKGRCRMQTCRSCLLRTLSLYYVDRAVTFWRLC